MRTSLYCDTDIWLILIPETNHDHRRAVMEDYRDELPEDVREALEEMRREVLQSEFQRYRMAEAMDTLIDLREALGTDVDALRVMQMAVYIARGMAQDAPPRDHDLAELIVRNGLDTTIHMLHSLAFEDEGR